MKYVTDLDLQNDDSMTVWQFLEDRICMYFDRVLVTYTVRDQQHCVKIVIFLIIILCLCYQALLKKWMNNYIKDIYEPFRALYSLRMGEYSDNRKVELVEKQQESSSYTAIQRNIRRQNQINFYFSVGVLFT